MARIKPRNTITSKDQAITAMAAINKIDMQLASWDMNEANEIAGVRTRHSEIQKKGGRVGIEAEKAFMIKELEVWAERDVETWEKKTYETNFGKMGFRISTPAVVLIKKLVRSFKEAVELLRERMPEFARQVYEVDKEAILSAEREGELNLAELNKCGLAVDQKEEFWIETNASKDLEEAAKRLRAA